ICISNKKAIEISRDKHQLFQHFRNNSVINVIPTYELSEILNAPVSIPIIAKPKNGRSSEGIQRFSNLKNLKSSPLDWKDYIFQPIINGDIFTVDYIRDQHGNEITIPRKELIRTVSGAGLTVETLPDMELSKIVSEVGP